MKGMAFTNILMPFTEHCSKVFALSKLPSFQRRRAPAGVNDLRTRLVNTAKIGNIRTPGDLLSLFRNGIPGLCDAPLPAGSTLRPSLAAEIIEKSHV